MKKIITAINNPIINEKLKKEKIEVIGKDIQYKEGILEILENNKEINFILIDEKLPGEIKNDELINKIKTINKNIEIILVNDGSIDRSGVICKKYKCNYENIIYINQCNQGPSVARNNGIARARGKYIAFIDVDDEVKDNFINKIMDEIKRDDIDLFMWGIEYQWINNEEIKKIENVQYDTKEYTSNKFLSEITKYFNEFYFNFVWNKLYKKDIILKNKIQFNKNFKRSEDLLFNLEYIKYIKDI